MAITGLVFGVHDQSWIESPKHTIPKADPDDVPSKNREITRKIIAHRLHLALFNKPVAEIQFKTKRLLVIKLDSGAISGHFGENDLCTTRERSGRSAVIAIRTHGTCVIHLLL